MKDFAEKLYKGKTWQRCRASYLKSVGGLCEKCLQRGIVSAAVIVHHKKHIDEQTITDPAIAYSFDNLTALCRRCHAEEHSGRVRRYEIDQYGRVTIRDI